MWLDCFDKKLKLSCTQYCGVRVSEIKLRHIFVHITEEYFSHVHVWKWHILNKMVTVLETFWFQSLAPVKGNSLQFLFAVHQIHKGTNMVIYVFFPTFLLCRFCVHCCHIISTYVALCFKTNQLDAIPHNATNPPPGSYFLVEGLEVFLQYSIHKETQESNQVKAQHLWINWHTGTHRDTTWQNDQVWGWTLKGNWRCKRSRSS